MIRKLLLGTVAAAALSTTAFAADLPSRRAPPVYVPPIPVFSWTGFYIGGDIGFGFGEDRLSLGRLAATTHPNGILGGAHVGYNFAGIPGFGGIGGVGGGGLVFGVEGDVDGSDYRLTSAANAAAISIRSPVQASARARLGIAVDRALFYVTGGGAFAQFQTSYTAPGLFTGASHSKAGWTIGGGVEYAITTQWSLRGEYRYSDYGSFTDTVRTLDLRHREIMQKATVGFSYKFDTPVAPVVARY